MGGISKTTREGLALHAKWRREGTTPAPPQSSTASGGDESTGGDDGDELAGARIAAQAGTDARAGGDGAEPAGPQSAAQAGTDVRAGSEGAELSEAGRTAPIAQPAKRKAGGAGDATRSVKRKVACAVDGVDRKRPRTLSMAQLRATYPPSIVAAVRRAKDADVEFHFPPLSRYRFETIAEFESAVTEHFARYYGGYRRRSSLTTLARNKQLRTAEAAARQAAEGTGKPFNAQLVLLQWNSKRVFYRVVYWCLHGCIQKRRGTGLRFPLSTRFTGCPARITAQLRYEVRPGGETGWLAEVINEYTVHNHHISPTIYATYNTTAALVGEDELFKKLAWAVDVGGDPRIVRDLVSRETGSNYSQRKFENLVNYWLGGAPVLRSLQALVDVFAALPGYRCLAVKDQNGVLIAIVFQTAYQRAVVRENGDTLTMDWTHNTNNRGFHQGACVATTANGTSVPILDFLCVTQSDKMMETVFAFFIEHNPGITDRLRSMVIDKDFGEWRTIKKMFPKTEVVLCIFHVLKWFKHVVTQGKYNIGLQLRDDVLACLRAMVYAVSTDALEAQKNTLRQLLSPDAVAGHQAFLEYMDVNWYPHSNMWSYAHRGRVFTAGNTTSNRIESLWCSYKGTLGNRRRLDLCVEAIFQHATMILRREQAALAKRLSSTPLYEDADDRIRPMLMELSAYTAKHAQAQWQKYLALRARFRAVSGTKIPSEVVTVQYSAAKDVDFRVNTSTWTCSCNSHRGIDLPCRHLFFVTLDVLRLPVYPAIAIKPRWRMSEAVKLLPIINKAISEMEQLRVRLVLGADRAPPPAYTEPSLSYSHCVDDGDDHESPTTRFPATRSVSHVHLAAHEISDSRVISDMEKRNRFDTALEPAVDFATTLSPLDFNVFMREAASAMASLVSDWQGRHTAEVRDDGGRGDIVDPASSFVTQSSDRRVILGEIEREAELNAWRACRAAADGEDAELAEDVDEEDFAGDDADSSEATQPLAAQSHQEPPGQEVLLEGVSAAAVGSVVRRQLIGQHGSLAAAPVSVQGGDLLLPMQASDGVGSRPEDPTTKDAGKLPNDDPGIFASASFTLPPKKGRGNQRTSKQQAPPARPLGQVGPTLKSCPLTVREHNDMVQFCVPLEVHRLQAHMPVVLTESLVRRRKASVTFRSYVPRSLDQANAIVPRDVHEKLINALGQQRLADAAGPYERNRGEDPDIWPPQYVARIAQSREFPEDLVDDIGAFYSISDVISVYKDDMAWVAGSWENAPRVSFLQSDADCVESTLDAAGSTHMRAEIDRAYKTRVLATMLAVPETNGQRLEPGQRTCIPLVEIVGRIAFRQKLNDSVVNFSLQMLCARHADVVVIDSLNVGKMRVPRATLQNTRLVCFPLHMIEESHWCIVLVVRQQNRLRVVGYDPLGSAAGKAFMQTKWDSWCRLLIGTWHARDQKRSKVRSAEVVDVTEDIVIDPLPGLDSLQVSFNSQPRQPDGTSCGLLCVARAAGFMDARDSFAAGAIVDENVIKVMRLRLMWLVLCHSTPIVDTEKQTIARAYYTKFAAFT